MKRRKLLILMSLLLVLVASLSLARCGTGLGPLVDADANGMKY